MLWVPHASVGCLEVEVTLLGVVYGEGHFILCLLVGSCRPRLADVPLLSTSKLVGCAWTEVVNALCLVRPCVYVCVRVSGCLGLQWRWHSVLQGDHHGGPDQQVHREADVPATWWLRCVAT